MAGRGPQSFKKRQKEQQRKEWQEEKRAKRLQRKQEGPGEPSADGSAELPEENGPAATDPEEKTPPSAD